MTSKEAVLELICEAKSVNRDDERICFLRGVIEKDLEILEEHRKIEKELGIELTVLFSALKYGVYYFNEQGKLIRDYVYLTSNFMDVGVHEKLSFSFLTYSTRQTLLFENYGKTWSVNKKVLIKDELL